MLNQKGNFNHNKILIIILHLNSGRLRFTDYYFRSGFLFDVVDCNNFLLDVVQNFHRAGRYMSALAFIEGLNKINAQVVMKVECRLGFHEQYFHQKYYTDSIFLNTKSKRACIGF